MQLWKWLGTAAVLLIAQPAAAQATAAFQRESPAAGAAPATDSHAAAAEPVVHDVAPRQQSEPLSQPATVRARLPPLAPEFSEEQRWYGGFILMSDGISLATAIAGGFAGHRGEPLLWIGGGGYLLGAPVVHLAHGNPGRAAASLGLRVALPIAFFGVGTVIEDCHGQDFCGLGSMVIGVPLGMATAIALDAALLARDTVKRPLALVPTAAFGPNSASLGLSGSF